MISLEMSFMDSKGKASRTEKIKYSYSFNKDFTEIYVVSDNIPIPPYTANLKIIVKKIFFLISLFLKKSINVLNIIIPLLFRLPLLLPSLR